MGSRLQGRPRLLNGPAGGRPERALYDPAAKTRRKRPGALNRNDCSLTLWGFQGLSVKLDIQALDTGFPLCWGGGPSRPSPRRMGSESAGKSTPGRRRRRWFLLLSPPGVTNCGTLCSKRCMYGSDATLLTMLRCLSGGVTVRHIETARPQGGAPADRGGL
jgi:hypothetical protein